MSSWAATKYKTKNWSSYNDSLKQRGSLSIWFDPEMGWTPPPSGKRGRQQQFSDAAIQTCLTLKVLFGMPLRQTTGFVQSVLRLVGLDWAAPDFSSLCRRQKTLNTSLPYRGAKGPLNLFIDSTGIMAEGEGDWNARKHGGPKRRVWRKIHIGIDEETLEVRAVKSWEIATWVRADRYGCVLATISIGDEELGDFLDREGLARYWPNGKKIYGEIDGSILAVTAQLTCIRCR